MTKKNDISLALDELKKCGETLIALSEAMDLELLTRCSEVWVFGEVLSAGMQIEIDRAQQKGKTIRYVGEEEIKCTKY